LSFAEDGNCHVCGMLGEIRRDDFKIVMKAPPTLLQSLGSEVGTRVTFATKQLPRFSPGEQKVRLQLLASLAPADDSNCPLEAKFSIQIQPDIAPRLTLTLIVPHGFAMVSDCTAGFDHNAMDTVLVYRRRDRCLCLTTWDFRCYEVQGFAPRNDTARFNYPPPAQVPSGLRTSLRTGVNEVHILIEINEAEDCHWGTQRKSLWKKEYDLVLTANQLKALLACQQ
jgi:hypothetical protein